MRILVTGSAGFIGAALCRRLSASHEVYGIDNLNAYYDVKLKEDRLAELLKLKTFSFRKMDISDGPALSRVFEEVQPEVVVNLAAQAGVRYSLSNPHAYIQSNLTGFLNILEGCRSFKVGHLVFASSSSVYGANRKLPFSVHDNVDHPVSLYAASKKANELMAHSYSHLFGIPTTGLRFFTVYGPWGRPDMALFVFTKNILEGKPINVFNFGHHRRDFTYIDDIVEGVIRVMNRAAPINPNWDAKKPDPSSSFVPYRLYNIGSHSPVWLDEMISMLEGALGKKADRNLVEMQQGDVLETFADVEDLVADFDFKPTTTLKEGIHRFVDWYRTYYKC